MSLKDFFVEYQLSNELFSIKGVHDNDYETFKRRCGYCFTENDVKTFFGSIFSEEETLDLVSAELSFECCECGKINNQYDKVIVEGKCNGCNGTVKAPYFLSHLYDYYPSFLEDMSKYGYILFENYDNNDCVKLCINKEENNLTILETRSVKIYDFENRDGETKYGFVIKFVEQDDVYTPYLTNSKSAIGLFIDPIDFAELIQDEGSKYTVTPDAIIFEDRASADIAADVLYDQLRHIAIDKVERALYGFAKENYFGKKEWFVEQFLQRYPEETMNDTALADMFNIYTAARENNLYITVSGENENKEYHVTSYDLGASVFATDEHRDINFADVLSFRVNDLVLII